LHISVGYIALNTATLFQKTECSAKGKQDNRTLWGELGRRERLHVSAEDVYQQEMQQDKYTYDIIRFPSSSTYVW